MEPALRHQHPAPLSLKRAVLVTLLFHTTGALVALMVGWTLWLADVRFTRGTPREYGFPFPSCRVDIYGGFPHIIIWSSFLRNTLIYTVTLASLAAIQPCLRLITRRRRLSNLQCPNCRYPFNPRCTECGTHIFHASGDDGAA